MMSSGASGSSREKGGRWGPMCTRTHPAGELHALMTLLFDDGKIVDVDDAGQGRAV
jgi:hypothetical protein